MFGFLVKCAIVLFVFLLLYPELQPVLAPDAEGPAVTSDARGEAGPAVEPTAVVGVVRAAISDAAAFCERQPEACDGASAVADAIGARLNEGASALARTFSAAADSPPAPNADGATNVTTLERSVATAPAEAASRGTLTADDLSAEWSVPEVR